MIKVKLFDIYFHITHIYDRACKEDETHVRIFSHQRARQGRAGQPAKGKTKERKKGRKKAHLTTLSPKKKKKGILEVSQFIM